MQTALALEKIATFEDLGRDSEQSEQKARGLFEPGLQVSPAEHFCLSAKKHHQEMSLCRNGVLLLLPQSKVRGISFRLSALLKDPKGRKGLPTTGSHLGAFVRSWNWNVVPTASLKTLVIHSFWFMSSSLPDAPRSGWLQKTEKTPDLGSFLRMSRQSLLFSFAFFGGWLTFFARFAFFGRSSWANFAI